jgi:CheY-like chemotaxis protein
MHRAVCLLIDDDIDDREIFELAAGQADQSVKCVFAKDGVDAIEQLKSVAFIPQYIFLDLNMPRMSGKQCLAEIRKIPELDHVPVIIYSTSGDSRELEEAQQLGATDYLIKQPSIATLSDALAEFFQRWK